MKKDILAKLVNTIMSELKVSLQLQVYQFL